MRTTFFSFLLFSTFVFLLLTGFQCGPTLKDCAVDSDCGADRICVQYACQSRDTCTNDSDCKAPRTCKNSLCTDPAQGCASDKDCAAPRVCKNQACVDPTPQGCASDKDCAAPRVCKNQACVDPTAQGCASDKDCKAPHVCKAQACVDPTPACTKDADCTASQTCQAGACVEKQTGLCRLQLSKTSLTWNEIVIGGTKAETVELSNAGTGACLIAQATLLDLKGSSAFQLSPLAGENLAPGGKATLTVTFQALGTGTTTATVEIASSSAVLASLRLYGYTKADTTLPSKGWGVALSEGTAFPVSYIGGCFLKDDHFEVATLGNFLTGGINAQFGNMRETTDGGATWKCVNCTSGSSWPRQAYYEIVDMRIIGMACLGGSSYVHGWFSNNPPPGTSSLFYRTANTGWKGVNDPNNPLNGSIGGDGRLVVENDEWFFNTGSLLLSFTPATDGKFEKQTMRYASDPQGAIRASIQSLSVEHGLALVSIFQTHYSGGTVTTSQALRYNTDEGRVPGGLSLAQVAQYWPQVKTPCTGCTLLRVLVVGPQSFLVSASIADAKKNPTGFGIWRSDDRGQTWKQVFSATKEIVLTGDLAQVDSKLIFAVAGGSTEQSAAADVEGLLLESQDGGQTFQAVPASQLRGQSLPNGKLPSLHKLVLSPDRKTAFALGQGTILRWKF